MLLVSYSCVPCEEGTWSALCSTELDCTHLACSSIPRIILSCTFNLLFTYPFLSNLGVTAWPSRHLYIFTLDTALYLLSLEEINALFPSPNYFKTPSLVLTFLVGMLSMLPILQSLFSELAFGKTSSESPELA